jgi:hypothetical protein
MNCRGTYKDDYTCNLEIGCGLPGCVVNSGSLKFIMGDVKRFKEAHGHEVPDGKITVPSPKRLDLLAKLIREEHREVMLAIFPDWDNTGAEGVMAPDVVELAKELVDLVYVTVGMAVEFGYPLDRVWDEVHASNMRKIGPDGKFVVRDDGKILKPEGWVGPDIEGCLK